MPFKIVFTEAAERQFRSLSAREQRILQSAIISRLTHAPMAPTRSIKRLRPNSLAEFELRVGMLRALYNVEGDEVVVVLVGRKLGNKLIVDGEEFHGHQDNSPEQPGSESSPDAE
jgi:mRNA-degrading endonuclease RelE of RelBE toxin-antitoxin system